MRSGGLVWRIVPVIAVLVGYPSPGVAQAALTQAVGEPTTPQSLGMADALVAGGMGTSAMFSNPAGIAVGQVFHTAGWWNYAVGLERHVAGAAATDSTTPVAGGLAFTYTSTGVEGEQNNNYDARTAIAMMFADMISVGLNLKYVRADYSDGVDSGHAGLNDFSLDAGALFIYDRFFIGVAGTNLTNLDHPLAPLTLSAGGGVAIGPARVEFDATLDWSSFDEVAPMGVKYAVGGEVLLADAYVIRAGYWYQDIPDTHGIAAGVGYVSSAVAIDFGFQQDLSGARSDSRLGLSLRYFVN
jgi:hypothetical protein